VIKILEVTRKEGNTIENLDRKKEGGNIRIVNGSPFALRTEVK
jgi:hypothetical protein